MKIAWRWSRPAPAITSGPPAGKVLANIAAAGVDPAVLLTHMHPVPSAGLSDPATGRRYFSNAELVVHENEPAHWFDDDAIAKASERQRRLYSVQRPHAAGSEGRGVSRRQSPVARVARIVASSHGLEWTTSRLFHR